MNDKTKCELMMRAAVIVREAAHHPQAMEMPQTITIWTNRVTDTYKALVEAGWPEGMKTVEGSAEWRKVELAKTMKDRERAELAKRMTPPPMPEGRTPDKDYIPPRLC